MKISFTKLLTMIVLVTGYSLAVAGETTTDATVLKLSGSAKASIPGKSDVVSLQVGDHIPQGSTITTGPDSIAYIQVLSGAVSTVEPSTTIAIEKLSVTQNDAGVVTKQTAMLDLKSGNLVSTIDPSKRAINSYAVRTPKGVAAARGTSFTTSVGADTVAVSSTADSVTLTSSLGVTYTISQGNVTILGGSLNGQTVPLAQLATTNPAFATMVSQAVTALSTVIANNLGGIDSAALSTLSQQVVAVASAANPGQASSYADQVNAAINSPTSTFNQPGSTVTPATATADVKQASDLGKDAGTNGPGTAAPTENPIQKIITPSTPNNPPPVSPSS